MSQSGTVIDRVPCHFPNCDSSDGMVVYDKGDHVDGFCWVCGKYSSDPYQTGEAQGNTMSEQNQKYTVVDIYNTFSSCDLPDRQLRKETLDYFGVKVGLNTSNRTVSEHYYPVTKEGSTTGYKKRNVSDKTFSSIGDCKGGDMFGQYMASIAGGKKLFITEGEIDAMTVFQVLKDKNKGGQWEQINPAVVSITKGASGADKELARHAEFLSLFEQIVVVFDNDDAGRDGLNKVANVIPMNKLYTVKLPKKDPNDMLKSGLGNELSRLLVFSSQVYRPITIVGVEDIIEEAVTPPVMGLPWAWPSLNKWTYGRHPGNIYGLGAGVGVGKSTFWFAQAGYDMKNNLGKHGAFFFEEVPPRSLNLIAEQLFAKRLNDPSITISSEERRQMLEQLRDHIYFCDHRNMLLGSKDSWNEIVAAIRHMAIVENCQHITLDPMTALHAQMSSSEANEFLNSALAQMAALAKQLDVCIYYGCHLNAPQKGAPHEEGGRVLLSQFTGSKAMIRWSQYVMGIERNNQDPDEVLANTSWLRGLKARLKYTKKDALFPIYYNHEDGSYLEIEPDRVGNRPPSERAKENPKAGFSNDKPIEGNF